MVSDGGGGAGREECDECDGAADRHHAHVCECCSLVLRGDRGYTSFPVLLSRCRRCDIKHTSPRSEGQVLWRGVLLGGIAQGRPDPCIPASRPAGACSAPAPSRPVPRQAAGEERPWARPGGAGILNAEVGPDGAFVIEQTSREREAVP